MNTLVQVPDVEDLSPRAHAAPDPVARGGGAGASRQPAGRLTALVTTRATLWHSALRSQPARDDRHPSGREMVRQAEHILGHLHGVFAAVRSSASARTLRVGTFAGISGYAFPALDELVGDAVRLSTVVHHGDEMIDLVAEGSMDAALIGIAEQVQLPPHVVAHRLGTDELVAFVASGVQPPRRGSLPFLDRVVTYAPYDNSGPLIAERIAALGGTPRHAATAPVALEISRRRDGIAIVPSSAARMSGRPGDRVMASRVDLPVRLSVIARGELDPVLAAALPALAKALGLRRRTT